MLFDDELLSVGPSRSMLLNWVEGADAVSPALAMPANNVAIRDPATEARIVHEGRGPVAEVPRVAYDPCGTAGNRTARLPTLGWVRWRSGSAS
jgi:hypothetical protein